MKLLSKKFNFNLKIKNKHKIVPLVYAFAVTFAFILSLTKNKDVSASVNPYDQIPVSELEAGIEEKLDNSPASYVKDSLENIKSLFELVNYGSSEKVVDKEITVEKGDTFISLFTDLGLTYKEAHDIYETVKKVYNPSLLRVGQKIKLRTKINIQSQTVISVESILIEPNSGIRHILTKNEKQQYIVTTQRDELTDEVNSASGIISGSLSGSMAKHGVPRRLVADFIKIFSYSVDFRRDLRKGDRFEIIYENRIAPDGKVVKTGNILYAALKLRNDKISLYRFSDKYGNVDYYNEKGQAMKKFLHRKPMAYQQARISSPFGKRRHPIYKDVRIHWGVDYAAPRGSAVYAGGDGVVVAAKYNGGYGKYIKIRHNSEYSTAYGHLNGYAKGIKPGVRVKQGQLIAYVGSTGRSTGPHLHYEVIKNGKRVNPVTIKAATGNNLGGQNLKKFKSMVADLKKSYSTMFAERDTPKVAKK